VSLSGARHFLLRVDAGGRDYPFSTAYYRTNMDDKMAIEFIHGGHDPVLEFLFGCRQSVLKKLDAD
jgi:hypothetical protein